MPADTPTTDALEYFGEPLINYLSANRTPPDPVATEVVQIVNDWAARAKEATNEFDRRAATAGALMQVIPQYGRTLGSILRLQAADHLPSADRDDEAVIQHLIDLTVDIYPAHLLPLHRESPRDRPELNFPMPLIRHPSYRRLMQAIFQDASLSKLLPSSTDDVFGGPDDYKYLEVYSIVYWSNGQGGSLALSMLPDSLTNYVIAMIMLHGLSEDHIPNVARQTVVLARRLAEKQKTLVPCLVALHGISVSAPVALGDAQLLPRIGRAGNIPTAGEHVDATLEIKVPVQLLDITEKLDDPDDGKIWKQHELKFERHHETLRHETSTAQLAILLASESPEVPNRTRVDGTFLLNPLAAGALSWSTNDQGYRPSVIALSNDEAARVSYWFTRVKKHPKNLWMGARRLLSAVGRLDRADGFVDAVICWENAFGTPEGEVGFRVCGSMAKLLEPADATKRGKLFKELRELYRERSRLVHGATELRPQKAADRERAAVSLAIQMYRRLYEDERLLHAQDSNARSHLILLAI